MSAGRMITSLIGAFGGGSLGRMLGGRTGGMIGSMAGSMLAGRSGGIGKLLGGLTGGDDDQNAAHAAASELSESDAMILVKAMCNAAKADGEVDSSEIDAILERAGDVDPDDEQMIRSELRSPLDLQGFLAEVPSGMAAEVYAVSLLPIKVDTAEEAEYLRDLASGLGLSSDQVASIHDELGVS